MNNKIKSGSRLTLTAPAGGVTSGVPVRIGRLVVVPVASVAATLPFEGDVEGEFTVPKVAGVAWTEGQLIYWVNATTNFGTVSTGNQLVGAASAAAASGDTTGRVRLNGIVAIDS